MTTAVWTDRITFKATSLADSALNGATRLFFAVTLAGQALFAFTIASFYGLNAARGNVLGFNQHFTHGYRAGDAPGNVAVVTHVVAAFVILLAGALQLMPRIRERAPAFHRWTGRVYFVSAFAVSLAGLFMMWLRKTNGDLSQHLGTTLMAILIMVAAVMALRHARARDFRAHRVWALRLYLVVSGSLFIRAAIFLSFLLKGGAFGFDPDTFTGPFLTFVSFAQYLVPLAFLELYLRARSRGGAAARFGMAAALVVAALALAGGIFAVTMASWLPSIKKAFDPRTSIAQTLYDTIASSGVDAAIRQYQELKIAAPMRYNFDERELRVLGRELMDAGRFKDAIRVLELNAAANPQASMAFARLGEAYLGDGDKTAALASYRKALALDAQNSEAVAALRKLDAR